MTSSNSSSAESIGHDQLDLASYSSPTTFDTLEDRHQDSEGEHSDHRTGIETATEREREEDALPIEVARRAEYIGFLQRNLR